MDIAFKHQFIGLWEKYFPGAELPIAFYYTDEVVEGAIAPAKGNNCMIYALNQVRAGETLRLTAGTTYCAGGKRSLGFTQKMSPTFEYFLSCGIPGKMEGERYKQSPALVKEHMQAHPTFIAPAQAIVFKRWDALSETDQPLVIIFYAAPDVLSGLFTLTSYDEAEPQAVIAPMGSGCASIVDYPYHESLSGHPHAVLGMFDISARPHVPADMLTFAIPWEKFTRMVSNMEESFLITPSWDKVKARIA